MVEGALDGAPLFRNQPARERALDIFSQLRIWDTAHNNGVLIYLLLADHDFEIVADRGIGSRVVHDGWERICQQMETDFFRQALRRVGAAHQPTGGSGVTASTGSFRT